MRGGQTKSRPNELAFAPFVFPKGIERSEHNIDPKIVCFAFLQRSSRTSVCSLFFDRASSKSQFNIIASLRPSKTKASTQNLQSHSGNIDHYRCGEMNSSTACSIRSLGIRYASFLGAILDVSLVFCHALLCREIIVTQRVEVRCT